MAVSVEKILARDVMTSRPVCVSPWTTIYDLARIFEENEISGVPVVDHQGCLIGLVSKTDLIRQCREGIDGLPPDYLFEILSDCGAEEREFAPSSNIRVEDFMTTDVVTAGPQTPASELASLMSQRKIHRIVITEKDDKPVGIVTSLDLLGFFPP